MASEDPAAFDGGRDEHHLGGMCGRVMQAGGPLHYAIMDGLNVRDSRLDNYPRRWNGAPSQEFLVIRENRKTGERAQTDQREVGDGRNAAHLSRSLRRAALHPARRWLLRAASSPTPSPSPFGIAGIRENW